jgi:hypothetical protein
VVLRDGCEQLTAADPVSLARRCCRLLADSTGVNEAAIWDWGFLERVSGGLYIWSLGAADLAGSFLDTAEMLVQAGHQTRRRTVPRESLRRGCRRSREQLPRVGRPRSSRHQSLAVIAPSCHPEVAWVWKWHGYSGQAEFSMMSTKLARW